MILKKIVTVGLLLFVAVSLGVLCRNLVWETQPDSTPEQVEPPRVVSEPKTIVYCFHISTRCPMCRAIEAHTLEALELYFADEMARGRINWQVVDYQSPGNEHFIRQYELTNSTVVLADEPAGQEARWKKLPHLWDHAKDPLTFHDYVHKELRCFLEEGR